MQNILATNPGEYIRGAVTATASNCKSIQTKSGKTIFKCELRDGDVVVDATSFSRSFHELEGKRVEFKGMGIKRGDDFKGRAGIVIGERATFKILGEPEGVQMATDGSEPVKTEGKAVSKASKVEGVTVGMAINKAVDIVLASGTVTDERIWRQASALIRLSSRLQAGDLAPEGEETKAEDGPF